MQVAAFVFIKKGHISTVVDRAQKHHLFGAMHNSDARRYRALIPQRTAMSNPARTHNERYMRAVKWTAPGPNMFCQHMCDPRHWKLRLFWVRSCEQMHKRSAHMTLYTLVCYVWWLYANLSNLCDTIAGAVMRTRIALAHVFVCLCVSVSRHSLMVLCVFAVMTSTMLPMALSLSLSAIVSAHMQSF